MARDPYNSKFKKGKRNNPVNYRPISLTYVLSKVMESLASDFLLQHMVHNNLFATVQHGFLSEELCLSSIRNYGIMVQLYRGREMY